MKKTIFTLSLVALFSVASHAQDNKSTKGTTKENTKTVNDDGTAVQTSTTATETPVKKGGTRMAINEKGTSGGVKPKGRTEEKKSESPAGQPGAGKKD
ncbi:MAG: hypothetical protein H0W61_05220 [Bacteroidetes bacterium]|nr:hypothetical protein [Bacteroidota bacterium]